MVRLSLNTGRENGIQPGDIVGVIAGTTGLTREVVGAIKLLPRQTLVDVSADHVDEILGKISGIRFKGQKLFATRATERVRGAFGDPRGRAARPAAQRPFRPKAPRERSSR